MADFIAEISKRRTFAIISHPDAGKTTLTEKLLLYGGAIHLAGAVRAKKNQRHTTSDWMEIEKERGISISTTALQFPYKGYTINLLDTPGHRDFSEDTYRTLAAVDAAVMLIDCAKGVEPQTRKLFEVCRMRGIPIFTFINKMDRPGQAPLELLHELEEVLGIRSCPMNWPIGMGDTFIGVFDREKKDIVLYEETYKGKKAASLKLTADSPEIIERADEQALAAFRDELELLDLAGDPLDFNRVRAGQLTPVFFGSASNNFGVENFLEKFIELSPTPAPRTGGPDVDIVEPTNPKFSGFIFKIQANMDPQHRDRVSFLRVVSGIFRRGMDAHHARLGKKLRLSKPCQFFGQDRHIVEIAYPGDIIGFIDTQGELRIGDTLTEIPKLVFDGIPRFSPEHFATVLCKDPLKRKQMQKGIEQLAEEGVVQIYRQPGMGDKDPVVGVVGSLQFEVLEHRLKTEYGATVKLDILSYEIARWLKGERFGRVSVSDGVKVLEDRDGLPIALFRDPITLRWCQNTYADVEFLTVAPLVTT